MNIRRDKISVLDILARPAREDIASSYLEGRRVVRDQIRRNALSIYRG